MIRRKENAGVFFVKPPKTAENRDFFGWVSPRFAAKTGFSGCFFQRFVGFSAMKPRILGPVPVCFDCKKCILTPE